MYHIPVHSRKDENSISERVDQLIYQAIEKNASDIHIESHLSGLRIRYRLDGMLYDQDPISKAFAAQIVARIKICSMIDIAQKRIPQDGKFRLTYEGRGIDLRVSTFPSVYGEKIVIRILDRVQHMLTLDQLGFQNETLQEFEKLLEKPHGFILVTGPTGSGKTTTLYAALTALHAPHKNIITLEDPVEYNLDGITQGQIHPEAGFTFAKGIRAILRQDPDIAMIGEIRDAETAKTAIEASLTGHLVLSTLHTNESVSALMRLMDMGVAPFLLNASISGILAQRLVRVICSSCKISYVPDAHELSLCKIPVHELYKGRGCLACFGTGYKGRIGIFELLVLDDALRSCIGGSLSFEELHQHVKSQGFKPMLVDGMQKVVTGMTTIQELMRVIS